MNRNEKKKWEKERRKGKEEFFFMTLTIKYDFCIARKEDFGKKCPWQHIYSCLYFNRAENGKARMNDLLKKVRDYCRNLLWPVFKTCCLIPRNTLCWYIRLEKISGDKREHFFYCIFFSICSRNRNTPSTVFFPFLSDSETSQSEMNSGRNNSFNSLSHDQASQPATRRTLSQFWGFRIRDTAFLHYIKLADLLIAKL